MGAGQLRERRAVRGSRPGYAAARAVGGGLGGLLVAGSAFSLVSTTLHQEGGESAELPEQITRLVVEAPRGDVDVTEIAAGSAARPQARLSSDWVFTEPTMTVEDDGGEVTLTARCQGSNLGRCITDLEVQVPAGTPVLVSTQYGDIDVTSTSTVDARTSAGDVQVRGRPTTVRVETSAGEVTVDAAAAPDDVTVTTSLGDVHLTLPVTEDYAVTTRTNLGEQQVTVPVDPAAPHTVDIRSSVGDITVRPAR